MAILCILMKTVTRCRRLLWLVLLIALCTLAFDHTIAQLLNRLGPKAAAPLATPILKIAAHPFPRRNLQGAGLHRLPGRRSRVLLVGRLLPPCRRLRRLHRALDPSFRTLPPTLGRLYLSFI